MEQKKVIGFYDYTVVLTYLGMIVSFMGIFKVINGAYKDGVLCLLAAGVCDMMDGTVAATKDRSCYEKHFGIQIDSLCDLISFGVLPAIFVYMITGQKLFVASLTCFYMLCGLIRLAYFNVQEFERQKRTEGKREVYLGIPITSSAMVLPFIYLLYEKVNVIGTWIFLLAAGFLGVGFVMGIEIKKPKLAGKIALIAVGVLELAGLLLLGRV